MTVILKKIKKIESCSQNPGTKITVVTQGSKVLSGKGFAINLTQEVAPSSPTYGLAVEVSSILVASLRI